MPGTAGAGRAKSTKTIDKVTLRKSGDNYICVMNGKDAGRLVPVDTRLFPSLVKYFNSAITGWLAGHK